MQIKVFLFILDVTVYLFITYIKLKNIKHVLTLSQIKKLVKHCFRLLMSGTTSPFSRMYKLHNSATLVHNSATFSNCLWQNWKFKLCSNMWMNMSITWNESSVMLKKKKLVSSLCIFNTFLCVLWKFSTEKDAESPIKYKINMIYILGFANKWLKIPKSTK